ncbi:MAG: fibronectin type III domain-containing protein, partial [Pseudomonadota bacterium]
QADIYWGKTSEEIVGTGYKTPYSRSLSASKWENWCYQVKKDGYFDSDIVRRQEETYRYLDFYLIPLKTTITSDPPGATVYWGPSRDQVHQTIHKTPRTVTVKDVSEGASWRDWYFQVRKDGYYDSEIIFLPRQPVDRNVHYELKSFRLDIDIDPVTRNKVILSWEDHFPNELGFEIERKKGRRGTFLKMNSVDPGVTSYVDTGLEKGMSYFYRVRAYHSYRYSAYSEEIRVRIPAD